MKIYNKIAYIVLILITVALGISVYKVYGRNGANEDVKNKSLAEIKFLENKFFNLFNQLNNINFENYTISSTDIKEQNQKSSSESSTGSSSGGEETGGSSSSESGEDSKQSQNSSQDSQSSNDNKKYEIEQKGILTSDNEINWDYIKNDVEKIYTSLYSTTVDLYQTSINQEDIINFNKEYDNLTKAVKDEDKEATLTELSILYNYLPKFMESCADKEKEKTIIKTKNNIFKAYSRLDREEWQEISQDINNASQEFTKLVTNIENKEKGNQYNTNKIYVIINELQNAVILKDKEVFLIKYKNLLEELENI